MGGKTNCTNRGISRLILLSLVIFFAVCSCSEKIVNESADALLIKTAFKPGSPSAFAAFLLTVSADNMRTISTTLSYQDGFLVGQVSVPPGKSRRFVIEAQDETGRAVYRGENTIDIVRGYPVELSITLQPIIPSLNITPHMTSAVMGTDISLDIYAWNIPDLYDISFALRIGDTEDLLLYDSASIGDNLTGSPTVNISSGPDSIIAALGRLDAVEPFVDSSGNGHILRLFFHSHYDTPLDVDTVSLSLAIILLSFSTTSTITPDSVFTDESRLILTKDSPTGDSTTSPVWAGTYGVSGDDWGNAVAIASNGNIVSVGQAFASATGWNAYVVAVDSNGTEVNKGFMRIAGNDIATDIISVESRLFMTGWMTTASDGEDILFAELDNRGTIVHLNNFGGAGNQRANDITTTSGGDMILVGKSGSTASDVFAVKINTSGDTVWTRTYDFNSYDEAFSAVEASNGDIVIAGVTGLYVNDFFILRIDSDGNHIWSTIGGGTQLDWVGSIAATQDDGFMLCGYTYSFGAGAGDTYLAKFSAGGDFQWQKTLGSPSHEHGNNLIATSDGKFVIVGLAGSLSSGKSNAAITKVDQLGQVLWQRSYTEGKNNEAFGVVETIDNSYIITGSSASKTTNNFDTFILKMNDIGDGQ